MRTQSFDFGKKGGLRKAFGKKKKRVLLVILETNYFLVNGSE